MIRLPHPPPCFLGISPLPGAPNKKTFSSKKTVKIIKRGPNRKRWIFTEMVERGVTKESLQRSLDREFGKERSGESGYFYGRKGH